jgi:hypothetical protein
MGLMVISIKAPLTIEQFSAPITAIIYPISVTNPVPDGRSQDPNSYRH